MSRMTQVVVVLALLLSALFLGIQFWTTSVIAVRSCSEVTSTGAAPGTDCWALV